MEPLAAEMEILETPTTPELLRADRVQMRAWFLACVSSSLINWSLKTRAFARAIRGSP
ncbi:MAG: hypothetical protein ACI9E1_001555 [Cryomorphaceae bacterium]